MDSPVRLAYILAPLEFGGAEKVSLEFFRNMDKERFLVDPILLVRPWEEETLFAKEIRKCGFDYVTVPVGLRTDDGPIRILRAIREFHRILSQAPYQLIHTNGYFADICALPVARKLGISTVSTCHGYIEVGTDRKMKINNALDKFALRLSKRIITVSEDIKASLVSNGIDQKKIRVVQNAVSQPCDVRQQGHYRIEKRKELNLGQEQFIAGYVGRLSEEKGANYLVDAIAKLCEQSERVKLVLVGDGPERDNLEAQVRALGIDDAVIFAGFQANIAQWMSIFDAFILPSLTEGTPMALLEAMSMRLPVIASAVGGVPKIIKDGQNGILTEAQDVGTLARQLNVLLENPSLAKKLGEQARETIQKEYDVKSWCRSIEQCYLDCL